MRGEYEKIQQRGAEVVTIGTGNADYARAFVRDEEIPFPVLVDDEAKAAHAASIQRVSVFGLFSPDSFPGALRAWKAGHRIGKPGARTNQLGATFVVGPGPVVRYQHRDVHTSDHAPMEEILAALV